MLLLWRVEWNGWKDSYPSMTQLHPQCITAEENPVSLNS
jgi:hypothetical protein